MEYRIKKNQIFKKQLPVPSHIRHDVYNCKLNFEDYIKYELEGKIPISCLRISDRMIVERFGIERAKQLDWSLLNIAKREVEDIKDVLLRIAPDTLDINDALYKSLNTKLAPENYTEGMRKKYPNREAKINENDSIELQTAKKLYNAGRIDLEYIIKFWDHFKDKDLTFALINDKNNSQRVTDDELKSFMADFKNTASIISKDENIYELIRRINDAANEDEKVGILKSICEKVLSKTEVNKYSRITLDNEQYKELFKYTSMKEYLSRVSGAEYLYDEIYKDLEIDGLTQEYLLDSGIPVEYLKNRDVIIFIRVYGIKNIVEFDRECGNFFTKDDCCMLRNMYKLYLHYAVNNHDRKTSYYTRAVEYDSDGNYIYRTYTKDEFYEAMRRMIIGGPTNFDYIDSAPDYRQMTGEFKRRNNALFLASEAPEELKRLFYTKSLTPEIIKDNPEYIPYLEGKDLSSCFENVQVNVEGSSAYLEFENLYSFLLRKSDFTKTIYFIKEYDDILKIIYNRNVINKSGYELVYNEEDDYSQLLEKTNNLLIKILIELNMPYPQNIPKELYQQHPEAFLSNDAPLELQKAFYGRTLSTNLILENLSYIEYLKDKDLQLVYKYMPITIVKNKSLFYQYGSYRHKNIIKVIQDEFKEDALTVTLEYGKYLEEIYKMTSFTGFELPEGYTREILLDSMDEMILKGIIEKGLIYDDKMSKHFKEKNKTFFIDEKLPKDLKDKFYNRQFTIEDFNNNPDLIDIFNETNIICGFNTNVSWLIPLIKGDNEKLNNLTRLKILTEYYKIQDVGLQTVFKEYIESYKENVNLKTISNIAEVFVRLSNSNSSEMYNFRKELAHQILNTANPIESINKVEKIFIKNNIPTVGKTYSCFEILHPDFKGFDMESNTISPTLQKAGNTKRKYIVFNDLIKTAFGSNNRSINKYIEELDKGYKLYSKVKNNNILFEELSIEEQETLKSFRRVISTLYDKTLKGRTTEETIDFSHDVIQDIKDLEIKLSENKDGDYNLADRVVRMFCGGAGINTIKEAQEYVYRKVTAAEKRNIAASRQDMVLVRGDLIKGINDIKYLRNILQNGSVSKEYLGSSAGSDATPLDTDVSMVLTETGSTREKIGHTNANSYGNIWLVLKNDDRFKMTRKQGEIIDQTYDKDKLELFSTGIVGLDHYGIRTGFASSEINYIVVEKYDTRIGLEIAMNGFYIPVADKDGKIVFTPEDYKEIRDKMTGLSYFNETKFVFSENLVNEDILSLATQIEESNKEIKYKRDKINAAIKEALEELGLSLKTSIDGDLSQNYVELIDTGSTGRGTNKPGDGDFDFMMRLDRKIMSDPKKLDKLKQILATKLGIDRSQAEISTGDFRMKNVTIDDVTVDIDISFVTKTDSIRYSTDMALQDRLDTIRKQDKEKYNYVVANILLAKKVLKAGNAYKPNRGENPEGGLGGVGIENWILQHGGSFYDAAKTFVAAAEKKSFEDFLHSYEVWDFGENHFAEKRGKYIHDEYVSNNMSREGFIKMVDVLKTYLKEVEKRQTNTETYQI